MSEPRKGIVASLTAVLFLGGPNRMFVSYAGTVSWMALGAFCVWIISSGQLKVEEAKQ